MLFLHFISYFCLLIVNFQCSFQCNIILYIVSFVCFLVSFCIFFITFTFFIMFTNVPASSQIYGTWNVAGTGAVDDGCSGYYQIVKHQLDELAYCLEHLARKSPSSSRSRDIILTHTHEMLGGMIISTWDMTMCPCTTLVSPTTIPVVTTYASVEYATILAVISTTTVPTTTYDATVKESSGHSI